AREIAAGGAEREHGASGQEVVQRLLLDRVDAEAARAPVRGEHDLAAVAHPDEAEAALPLAKLARARADVALDAAVLEAVPVRRRDRGLHLASVAARAAPQYCAICASASSRRASSRSRSAIESSSITRSFMNCASSSASGATSQKGVTCGGAYRRSVPGR